MNYSKNIVLQFHNLTVEYDGRKVLNRISGVVNEGDKIGLVGSNGSGKTTLLRSLAGELAVSANGNVKSYGAIAYVPQLNSEQANSEQLVYQYIHSKYENWWEVQILLEQNFQQTIAADQMLSTLSGGELLKLNICIALAQDPAIFLLDEPTNHLDIQARKQLIQFLQSTDVAFMIVSHDSYFLDQTTSAIWELSGGMLSTYGGNFSFYKQQKRNELESLQEKYESRQKMRQKLIRSAQRDAERSQRNLAKGKQLHNPGEDKYFKGFFGNQSQKQAGKNKLAFEKQIEEIEAEMAELKSPKRRSVNLQLAANQRKGSCITISKANLSLPNGKVLVKGIDLQISHGDRLAILGRNGSGKSTLIQQFAHEQCQLLQGSVNYGNPYQTMYIDQNYELLNLELSLLENLQIYNKEITYKSARNLLASHGFTSAKQINAKTVTLSGGEQARLALAIASCSLIDLLVMDEPTNNLDIETKEVIAKHIAEFSGALVIVSHDIDFLKQIGIDRFLQISDEGKLVTTDLDQIVEQGV